MERAEGRNVAGGSAAGGSRRSGTVSNLAAAAASHASRTHLPVGAGWTRPVGLRHLDEDGHAVHRQLVAGAGYQNSSAHHPTRVDGLGRELIYSRTGGSGAVPLNRAGRPRPAGLAPSYGAPWLINLSAQAM